MENRVFGSAHNSPDPLIQEMIERDAYVKARSGYESLEHFRSLPRGRERSNGIMLSLVKISREISIEEALKISKEFGNNDIESTLLSNMFTPQSAIDLKRVISKLGLIKNAPNFTDILNEIANSSRAFDDGDIFKLMNDPSLTKEDKAAIEFCYATNIIKKDPIQVSLMIQLFDAKQKSLLIPDIIDNWPTSKINEGVAWLFKSTSDSATLQSALWNLTNKYTEDQPDKIMDIIESAPPSNATDNAHKFVVDIVYDTDPEKAISWAKNLPLGNGRKIAMQAILDRVAQNNIKSAIETAKGFSTDASDHSGIAYVGHVVGLDNPVSAMQLSTSLIKNEGEQKIFQNSVLLAWAMTKPENFIQIAKDNPSYTNNENVVDALFQSYSAVSHKNAADWFVANNLLTDNRINNLITNWMFEDSMGASQWIYNMRPSHLKNTAIISLINQIKNTDPFSAAQWEKLLPKE